jgi:DNA-binding MarR family transcriptional regulator
MLEQQFTAGLKSIQSLFGQFALPFAHAGHLPRSPPRTRRPLALSHLAARAQVGAAHIHITRHLGLHGSRLTELAHQAGMSKQAMGDLVTQCEAWGLVRREPDPRDARARRIVFTDTGLLWLDAFRAAVAQAEDEFRSQVGDAVATVVALGLEAYGSEAPGARAAVPAR